MGFLEKFVNNSKEKRVNEMTQEEMLKALSKRKLDDFVVDLIAQRLGIDPTVQPEGFQYIPSDRSDMSEKQDMVRMLAGQFVYGDTIVDEKNYMKYTYERNEGSNSYGFHGKVDLKAMKESGKTEFDISVPAEVQGIRVNSLVEAFCDTKQYKINADIQARNVSVNDMMKLSGLTTIPDFTTMNANEIDTWYSSDPDYDDWGYECIEVKSRHFYEELSTMPNISPQAKLDFVIEHYAEENDTANKRFAVKMAKDYFGLLSENHPYLRKSDIDSIEELIKTTGDEVSKDVKIKECMRYQIAGGLTDLGKDIFAELKRQLDLKTPEDIYKAYITSLKPEEMEIRMMEVVNKNREISQMYYIVPNDKDSFSRRHFYSFDAQTGELKHCGFCNRVDENSILTSKNRVPISIDKLTPVDDKMAVVNLIAENGDRVANDVLTNDNLHVPTSQIDDKEIEEI